MQKGIHSANQSGRKGHSDNKSDNQQSGFLTMERIGEWSHSKVLIIKCSKDY
jgi:hypothetical protein